MWVARNRDGKYHLFDEKPTYDEWYDSWVDSFYRQANDELTVQYIKTNYKEVKEQELGFTMYWGDEPIEIDVTKLIKVKHSNKKRKERTATDRPLNKYIEHHGSHCWYFDGFYNNHAVTECMSPWSFMCKGNKFDCGKLKYKWLASLSEEKRNTWLEEHEGVYKNK